MLKILRDQIIIFQKFEGSILIFFGNLLGSN